MFKLKIHSIVDIITNSSTVIYTYQNSEKEAEELLQEILNLFGDGEKVNDLFYFGVFADNTDTYCDRITEDIEDEDEKIEHIPDNWEEMDYKEQEQCIETLQKRIMKGEIEKPKWMTDCEKNDDSYSPGLSLHILPKDSKYTLLTEKMLKFLNSPSSDGGYDA